MAMAERIEVPLDRHGRHDLEAMLAAIRPDTTIVSICNPNNPTGTVLPAVDIAAFVEEVPERVLVVVDEAYHEYVSDPVHATAVPLAVERPNLIVTRTFSKIYGLAALRVGYAVSRAATVAELRKAQAPFTVSTMAQDAALESLAHEASMRQRAAEIVAERTRLEAVLAGRSLEVVPSQANFVSFRLGAPTAETSEAFLRHGVILRAFGDGWVRVTVGTPGENDRFLEAFENEHDRLRSGPVPADFG
jgi:histidinol-phosphate aminotransferase